MVTIYKTEHCPMCKTLMARLEEKKIQFNIIDDPEQLKAANITYVPVLAVNNKFLNFAQALQWIGEQDD